MKDALTVLVLPGTGLRSRGCALTPQIRSRPCGARRRGPEDRDVAPDIPMTERNHVGIDNLLLAKRLPCDKAHTRRVGCISADHRRQRRAMTTRNA
jgi:hypothetical protein